MSYDTAGYVELFASDGRSVAARIVVGVDVGQTDHGDSWTVAIVDLKNRVETIAKWIRQTPDESTLQPGRAHLIRKNDGHQLRIMSIDPGLASADRSEDGEQGFAAADSPELEAMVAPITGSGPAPENTTDGGSDFPKASRLATARREKMMKRLGQMIAEPETVPAGRLTKPGSEFLDRLTGLNPKRAIPIGYRSGGYVVDHTEGGLAIEAAVFLQ